MRFEVLGVDYDRRIRSYMVSGRADYEWYLAKTQGSEANLEIQRDIIKGTNPSYSPHSRDSLAGVA